MITKTGNELLEKIGGMRQHSLRKLVHLCNKYRNNPRGVQAENIGELVLGRFPADLVNRLREDVRLAPIQVRNGRWIIDKDGIQHLIERHMNGHDAGTAYAPRHLKSMLNDLGYSADAGELVHVGAYKPLFENGEEFPFFTNAIWSPHRSAVLKKNYRPLSDVWHMQDTGDYRVNTLYPKTKKNLQAQQELRYIMDYDKDKRVFPMSVEHKRLSALPDQNTKVFGR